MWNVLDTTQNVHQSQMFVAGVQEATSSYLTMEAFLMEALNTTGSILVCRSHSQLPCLSCLSRLESFCYSSGVPRSKDTVTSVTMSPHRVAVQCGN